MMNHKVSYDFLSALSSLRTSSDLEDARVKLIDKILSDSIIYMNIGFILSHIRTIYPDLSMFKEKYIEDKGDKAKSPIVLSLKESLCKLQESLKYHPGEYLYILVRDKNKFEITHDIEDLKKVIGNISLRGKYLDLWKNFNPYYLTIYYGNVFVLDSLIIAKNKSLISPEIIEDIKTSLHYLSGFLMFQIGKMHALRSGVSAIMGRNMSHNIGSHVLSRIAMGGIDGWTANKSLEQIKKCLDAERRKKDIIQWSKDVQLMSRYIQQRMDFIAQISTEWPSWTEPAYLINDLIRWFLSQKHVLNNIAASEGLRAHLFINNEKPESNSRNDEGSQPSKHKNGSTHEENIEVKKKEDDCISESNEMDNPSDIRFHVFLVPENCWNNHDSVKDRMNFLKTESKDKDEKHLKCLPNADSSPTKDCESCTSCRRILLFTPGTGTAHRRLDEDIPLSIPGGIIGYHAFYVILENIIRNGAKHDFTKGGRDHFDVVIEVLYDPDEKIGIHIQKGDKRKRIPAFLFRIYNNTSKIGDGLRLWDYNSKKGMNNILQTSIITETGELNKGNWGLSEMKIAAGFLQQRDIFHIGDGKDRITGQNTDDFKKLGEKESGSDVIISAVESPIGTLGYEFYIPKPRTFGIVCSKGKEEADNGR